MQLIALVFCFGDKVLSPGSSLATDFLGVVPLWRVAKKGVGTGSTPSECSSEAGFVRTW